MEKVEDGENDSESISDQFEENQLMNMNRHFRNRKNHRSSKTSTEIETMYKEALMNSIFGRFEEASKKLKLIITLSPDNPEPYHLLGTMHEEIGEYDKAVDYLFMSTYLSPPNLEKWIKVADISFELKMYTQAAYCYGRALKIENYNLQTMTKRAEAFEMSHQTKKAIIMYKKILAIAQSAEVIKKYAKLRFKRGEYGLCRQLLESFQGYQENKHLVNMICETYLKEKKYIDVKQTLLKNLEGTTSTADSNSLQNLPLQFIKLILICQIILKQNILNYQKDEVLASLIESYEESYMELFNDIIFHIKDDDEETTYKMLCFLLTKPHNRTVDNYLLVIQHMIKKKDASQCLNLIEEAIQENPNSAELVAQKNYLKKYFGISKNTSGKVTYLPFREQAKEDQLIFYSDQESPNQQPQQIHFFEENNPRKSSNCEINNQKTTRRKSKEVQTQNPEVLAKLIQNSTRSIQIILQEIHSKLQEDVTTNFIEIENSLDLLINISNQNKMKEESSEDEREGLYFKNFTRRRNMSSDGELKGNHLHRKHHEFFNVYDQQVISYINSIISYMLILLKEKYYKKIIQLSQKLSKAYFFKWQNKKETFKIMKITIYQISLMACIHTKKFNSAIFFIRYLISRCPDNQLYLLILSFLMRVCHKKSFMSSMLSKYVDLHATKNINTMTYLLGIQYMENGCFELAANSFIKILEQTSHNIKKNIYLNLSVCLIQLASSRNTFNKLDFTNRSAFCLAKYSQHQEDDPEIIFNRARWFAQVKINNKAIKYFNQILSMDCDLILKKKSAYCLICIYRGCEDFQKESQLSQKYFTVEVKEQKQQKQKDQGEIHNEQN